MVSRSLECFANSRIKPELECLEVNPAETATAPCFLPSMDVHSARRAYWTQCRSVSLPDICSFGKQNTCSLKSFKGTERLTKVADSATILREEGEAGSTSPWQSMGPKPALLTSRAASVLPTPPENMTAHPPANPDGTPPVPGIPSGDMNNRSSPLNTQIVTPGELSEGIALLSCIISTSFDVT